MGEPPVVRSRQVRAGDTASERRIRHNAEEADKLERQGYIVERNLHKNGAFFAVIGNHHDHEISVGRIFAENGISFTLEREGNAKIRVNGRTYILPASDGRIVGRLNDYTHEIAALEGKPDARTVANAISHSLKPFVPDKSKTIQADIAITIAPKGSQYHRGDIANGVKEYKRRVAEGETKARPKLYLHVNEETRSIYRWRIK